MRYLFCILLGYASMAYGQENPLLPVTLNTFNQDFSTYDQSTHAVVMQEFGRSELMVIDSENALRVVHEYSVRIKILDQEGFDEANFKIPLYTFSRHAERIEDIKGTTYNLDGGKISRTELASNAIFKEQNSEFVTFSKFTLPDIRVGSIIEVRYRIYSPDIYNYRSWDFQTNIPKIQSSYTAIMPANFQYRVTLNGQQKLADTKSEILRQHFLLNGHRTDCSKMTYSMENIPAFKEESFMLARKNYLSAINFELEIYYDINGVKRELNKTWNNIDRELLQEKSFGGQLKRESIFKELLNPVLSDTKSDLQKAKAIYSYIHKQIKWNNVYGKYAQYGIKESLEKRTGNIGDINLALVTALNSANLTAFPVLISTRENGIPNRIYPETSKFNYVIALVKIGDTDYLLDASEEYLPFGELPLRCINIQGRVIYSKKSSDWIALTNHKTASTNHFFLGTLTTDHLLNGQFTITYTGLEALRKRQQVASFASEAEYFEHLEEKLPQYKLAMGQIENLNNLDTAFQESFELSMPLQQYVQNATLTINPILLDRITKNPFNLDERSYAVDIGARSSDQHTISIQLPANYILSSGPKNATYVLPEGSARFSYQSNFEFGMLQFRQNITLNRAIYDTAEYFDLKEFYSRIIQVQKDDFKFSW